MLIPLKSGGILYTLLNFNPQMPRWHQNIRIKFSFYNVREENFSQFMVHFGIWGLTLSSINNVPSALLVVKIINVFIYHKYENARATLHRPGLSIFPRISFEKQNLSFSIFLQLFDYILQKKEILLYHEYVMFLTRLIWLKTPVY